MTTEKTFTVVGTSVSPDGTVKVRWANDLAARVKILDRSGMTDIKLYEMPKGLTKLGALEWLRDNAELNDAEAEIVDLKIAEKSKASKRAEVKATLTKNVKRKAGKKSDPKVEAFVEKTLAEAE